MTLNVLLIKRALRLHECSRLLFAFGREPKTDTYEIKPFYVGPTYAYHFDALNVLKVKDSRCRTAGAT